MMTIFSKARQIVIERQFLAFLASPELAQGGIGGDTVQPRRKRRRSAKRLGLLIKND
jgi:hypothetical protein